MYNFTQIRGNFPKILVYSSLNTAFWDENEYFNLFYWNFDKSSVKYIECAMHNVKFNKTIASTLQK